MLAPSYTSMRDDVGRLTQKWPGVAENGSVYNHAAAFYIYALYQIQHADRAFDLLRKMIPSSDEADLLQRGQLPTFIPNYYRGARRQFERTAGRSSQLFNTGTVHWFYRCLPSHWPNASLNRTFRGASFDISISRNSKASKQLISVDGQELNGNVIKGIVAGKHYVVKVILEGQAADE